MEFIGTLSSIRRCPDKMYSIHTGSSKYEGEYSPLYRIFTQSGIQYPIVALLKSKAWINETLAHIYPLHAWSASIRHI